MEISIEYFPSMTVDFTASHGRSKESHKNRNSQWSINGASEQPVISTFCRFLDSPFSRMGICDKRVSGHYFNVNFKSSSTFFAKKFNGLFDFAHFCFFFFLQICSEVTKLPMFWVVATASGILGLAISFTSMWFLHQTGPTTYRYNQSSDRPLIKIKKKIDFFFFYMLLFILLCLTLFVYSLQSCGVVKQDSNLHCRLSDVQSAAEPIELLQYTLW